MPTVPKKVYERIVAGIKQFQPILAAAKSRDVNEADTVTIIKDMLADVFGYNFLKGRALKGLFVSSSDLFNGVVG